MSNRTVIYYDDLVSLSTTTLTASTEATGYEKEYLQDYTPQSLWQGTASASTMGYDFGSAVQVYAAWHGGSNMVSGDTTYQIRYGTTSAATTSSIYAFDKQENSFVESAETYQYAKTTMTKASGNPEFGKSYIAGSKFVLSKDFRRNYTGGTISEYITNRGRYGQIDRTLQYSKVIYDFEISGMNDTQKYILDEVIRKQENIIFWDGELQKAFFGIMDFGQPEFVKSSITGAVWNISGTFEESK